MKIGAFYFYSTINKWERMEQAMDAQLWTFSNYLWNQLYSLVVARITLAGGFITAADNFIYLKIKRSSKYYA